MEEAYERAYIEFIDYVGRNFETGMSDAVVHAESLTNIMKKEVEHIIEQED